VDLGLCSGHAGFTSSRQHLISPAACRFLYPGIKPKWTYH
jgi:hypothetical protein